MSRSALKSDAGKSALKRLGFKLSKSCSLFSDELGPNGKTETALSHGTRKSRSLRKFFVLVLRPRFLAFPYEDKNDEKDEAVAPVPRRVY